MHQMPHLLLNPLMLEKLCLEMMLHLPVSLLQQQTLMMLQTQKIQQVNYRQLS
jgi:hypothetical protein